MAINENGEIPWLILKTPNHNKFMPQVQPVVEPSLVTKRPTVKTTKSPSKNAPKSPPKSSSKSPPKNPSKSPNKSQSKNAAKSPSKSSPSKARQPNTKTKPPPPTTTTASPPVCPQSPACPKCPVQPSESSLPAIRRPIMKHSVSWDQYGTISFLKLLSSHAIDLIIKLYINLQILVEVLLMFFYLSIVSPHTNRCISLLGATFLWPALGMSRYCDVSLLLTYNK